MTTVCPNCNAPVNGTKFCTACGAKLETEFTEAPVMKEGAEEVQAESVISDAAVPNAAPMPEVTAVPNAAAVPSAAAVPNVTAVPSAAVPNLVLEPAPGKGSAYEPISTGGYFGIFLLMGVPVVGLIFLIVWACGGCRKVSKRNFSRAVLILMLIGVILASVGAIFGYIFADMVIDAMANYM